jgi:single-strand DNA-binding protein
MLKTDALIGRLGANPEIRYTPSGIPVAGFRVAVNEYWTGQNGEKQERTHWFSCIAWKNLAETVGKYLSKGSQGGSRARSSKEPGKPMPARPAPRLRSWSET